MYRLLIALVVAMSPSARAQVAPDSLLRMRTQAQTRPALSATAPQVLRIGSAEDVTLRVVAGTAPAFIVTMAPREGYSVASMSAFNVRGNVVFEQDNELHRTEVISFDAIAADRVALVHIVNSSFVEATLIVSLTPLRSVPPPPFATSLAAAARSAALVPGEFTSMRLRSGVRAFFRLPEGEFVASLTHRSSTEAELALVDRQGRLLAAIPSDYGHSDDEIGRLVVAESQRRPLFLRVTAADGRFGSYSVILNRPTRG